MQFNIDELNQLKEEGYLINQQHPNLSLIIWNYSQKTQYEGFWNETTIAARGLVTDLDGNVVSKGFPKFWNLEEGRHTPTDNFEIFEKLDGQYIGVFRYAGEMIVNSRGSFTSPYAIEAKRILDEKYPNFAKWFPSNHTACFELIGFEQIVVSYPEVDLIATGLFDSSGFELSLSDRDTMFSVPIVNKFNGLDYTNIKQLNWQNSEGFVVRFSNGSRCKIKFDDYIKLHHQMTNLSTTAIWEALMHDKPVSEILNDVPDEFFEKVREIENGILDDYINIERIARRTFSEIMSELELYNNRKLFAEIALKFYNPSILFAMYDTKDYSQMIWRIVKPKYEKI